ncbi:helix-turn-helix domain-containing protein [Labedaea rhizosphaerae]|uniref:Helix-turn-helix protein n=1 Tax=Labedaea rhizosphaerae TaxID=598644 RepID=A0A4R6S353_LABRH|nr:helix-turn-helix transcriptional regulator [Labedaea rhizosphaerae]TDP94032.1 helix-turn-helix protein [Labedaea rhizosphaerae]
MAEVFRASMRLRRIARQLKRWRTASGMKASDVAAQLGWSAAKLSKYENAAQPILPVEVLALGLTYHVPEDERNRLFNATAAAQEKGWWQDYTEAELVESAHDYLELETEAAVERTFKIDLIPGLLQTEAYAAALARADVPAVDEETIQGRAQIRVARQALLSGDDSLRVEAIISEAAMRCVVGGVETHRQQIERLLEFAEQDNITIQVASFEQGAHSVMGSPFDILSFNEDHLDDVVYIENVRFGRLLEDPASVETYNMNFAGLRQFALDPEQSVALIRGLIDGR